MSAIIFTENDVRLSLLTFAMQRVDVLLMFYCIYLRILVFNTISMSDDVLVF